MSRIEPVVFGPNLGMQLLDAMGLVGFRNVTELSINCEPGNIATLTVRYAILESEAERITELLRVWRLVPMIEAEGDAPQRKAAVAALLAAVQSQEGREALRNLGLQGFLEEIERE